MGKGIGELARGYGVGLRWLVVLRLGGLAKRELEQRKMTPTS